MSGSAQIYRVNYGNGQVGEACALAEAQRELSTERTYPAFAFIQRFDAGTADDPGDWFSWRPKGQKGKG